MIWKVFDYDQSDLIDNSPELQAYGDGACLAIAMKWCAHKKAGKSSLQFESLLANSPDEQIALDTWMKSVQTQPLRKLFDERLFKYYAANGEAVRQVIGNTKGKINNLKAYSFRLEKMSQWGRETGLPLLDDRVGFPENRPPAEWVREMANYAFDQVCAPCIGLISLTKAGSGGHALAYEFQTTPYTRVNFFDPNEGEYRATSLAEFNPWFINFLTDEYSDLSHHWWVIKFKR
jgi:hypothetical protein